jgi:hypothetical protein
MDKGRNQRRYRGSGSGGELKTIHMLGDPGSMTGDHQVGVAEVTSHGDRVVDRRHSVRGLRHRGRMSSPVHQRGSVKHEVDVARGVGARATRGASGGNVATRGMS